MGSQTTRSKIGIGLFLVGGALAAGPLASFAPKTTSIGIAMGILLAVLGGRPRLALVLWLLTLSMIPYWIGVYFVGFLSAPTIIGIAALITLTVRRGWRIHGADLYFGAFAILGLLGVLTASSSGGYWFSIAIEGGVAYLLGRALVPAAGVVFSLRAVSVILSIVGGLAFVEYLFQWHPYVSWVVDKPAYETWGRIQVRESSDRSEWAFGHSIALGGSLVAAIPFVLSSKFANRHKILMLAMLILGIVASASRSSMIAAGLTLALCIVVGSGMSVRRRLLLLSFSGIVAVWAFMNTTDLVLGSNAETAGSAEYRARMYETLIDKMSLFGQSGAVEESHGVTLFASFRSIDSTFLLVGLSFGWLLAIALLAPFVLLLMRIATARASVWEAAILGQIPLLATVALITQYQTVFLFLIGITVTLSIRKLAHDSPNNSANMQSRRFDGLGISARTGNAPQAYPTQKQRNNRASS